VSLFKQKRKKEKTERITKKKRKMATYTSLTNDEIRLVCAERGHVCSWVNLTNASGMAWFIGEYALCIAGVVICIWVINRSFRKQVKVD
jgi:hypothetical protein